MIERRPVAHVERILNSDPRVGRLGAFLTQLQAYQFHDRDDVEYPIEGTKQTITFLPEPEEAKAFEQEVRTSLILLCGGDQQLALEVRDHYLFSFFDERGLWPTDSEDQ